MKKITRRTFFRSAAAALPVGLLGGAGTASSESPGARVGAVHADLVVKRGNLLTMDLGRPHAEAMAIQGQHILAVGTNSEIENLIGPNTRVIDASGMTVTPGFVDGHSHPIIPENAVGANVNLPRIADVQAALRLQAARTPPGHWGMCW